MKFTVKTSESYSKRQLDLECLQSLQWPVDRFEEVIPSVTYVTPKVVSGTQKLVQRYAVLFTTIIGSDDLKPRFGTRLYSVASLGNVRSAKDVEILAKTANVLTKERIKVDDDNEEVYGKQPMDEKLQDCWIDRVVVDSTERKISIFASIRTKAGENVTFIVPTSAGIY